MKTSAKTIIITIMLAAMLMLSACLTPQPQQPYIPAPQGSLTTPSTISIESGQAATQQFKKFSSINEVAQFLQKAQQSGGYDGYGGDMMTFSSPRMATADMAVAESAGMGAVTKAAPAPTSAQDYSQTNIQVEHVDEADYVKNDGRYIYMIADNKLIIVDAFDAQNAKIVSETEFGNSNNYYGTPRPKELFINGDTLALFIEKDEESFYFNRYDIEPQQTYRQKTLVYVYDISDRANPKMDQAFESSGRYFQSRMIGDIVYLVTQEGANQGIIINEPMVRSSAQRIAPDIYYFDNPEQNYQFNTISSIDLGSKIVIDAKTLMMGYANTLMVSENNIYIAYQKQNYWKWGWYGQQYEKERFTKVIVPLLRGPVKMDVEKVLNSGKSEQEQWKDTSAIFGQLYKDMDDDDLVYAEYEAMMEEIIDALEEYDTKKALEDRKTIIQKLSISNGNIEYVAKGEVYGNLLNQWSLDEYNGNLRLATTVSVWNRKRIQYNNVYVLDADMKQIGEVTGIAQDEQIYSTRFMGDRLYMVTFRQTDPFFVIDLSNPQAPKVLGKLKIPGFSNYLHPVGENLIIGIGKETKENEWGGVTTEGIKIALFDVSDVANPKEKQKLEIGDQGSNSAALNDHRAFLFDKEKELMVIPISEVTRRDKLSEYRWSNQIWTGAYVFHIDEDGFEVAGKVKHSEKKSDYFYWDQPATVRRSLYMDDNLYTISNQYIKINDLIDELKELNTIRLPGDFKEETPIGRPMPEPIPVEAELVEVDAMMME